MSKVVLSELYQASATLEQLKFLTCPICRYRPVMIMNGGMHLCQHQVDGLVEWVEKNSAGLAVSS